MTGQRPGKTDLTVKVDAEMLAVVFQFLREDIDVAMEGSKRSYSKKNYLTCIDHGTGKRSQVLRCVLGCLSKLR